MSNKSTSEIKFLIKFRTKPCSRKINVVCKKDAYGVEQEEASNYVVHMGQQGKREYAH
jgi:hypothetical protein